MRLILAGALVLCARLALASVVLAQVADLEEPPPDPIRPRVEFGVTGGLTIGFPEFGAVASVPIDRHADVELMVSRMPPAWDGPSHVLVQVQLRKPFRKQLRSRKSLLVGFTRITALAEGDAFLGFETRAFVRPHAGASFQWPAGARFDFRFDVQGIFTFAGELPLVSRAVIATVWHPGAGR
jgi:hypothetical protein